ncbi:MAG: hypothetical protein KDD33_00955 [Bdellovibrionales bacterium]|nr:hypothetical protein [Bdellovibrionales bacterium]
MISLVRLLGIFIFAILVGAQEEADPGASQADEKWVSQKIETSSRNIQVPRELWVRIKESLKNDGVKAEVIDNFSIYPTSVQVELIGEEGDEALRDNKNYQLLLVDGGGTLDLFEYINGKGAFRIRVVANLVDEGPVHLLYVSHSPGRKMDDAQWGNGCGNIFDLSQVMSQISGEKGMLVTTSKRHYMHLMAGIYVFYQIVGDQLFLGYVRLTDSRYPQFSCSADSN